MYSAADGVSSATEFVCSHMVLLSDVGHVTLTGGGRLSRLSVVWLLRVGYVLLSHLHRLGRQDRSVCRRLILHYIAICTFNRLLLILWWQRQSTSRPTRISPFGRCWMTRWPTAKSFLIRQRSLVLTRAHYVLRYIDQVSFPVLFH